ncbi:rhodanese-like domain-containing protein [Candidatus Xianfuyuplasma coldseepsis]|uniref:Rhodanese-like domain-containing protein n=1 Tax=Candidatus Xianfuyuplasma coldseepsis TaxID=2782163 RepID=A0A7L7KNP4_9MOLU|nr:rhodanese-like domain-containing protein [Xianfuyuplasma coldseepsis]QMS84370.1 rhodanese-like domain-containing protein [Xianfuyuplasma coldseepsis]
MKRVAVVISAVVMIFALAACNTDKGYTNISNDELREMFDSDVNYYYIDVRTSKEYYEEHIEEFTMNIDYYHLEEDYSMLDDLDRSRPVIIMCNSGNRSASAAEIFVKEGFTEVYNVTKGIQGWDGETV